MLYIPNLLNEDIASHILKDITQQSPFKTRQLMQYSPVLILLDEVVFLYINYKSRLH